MVSSLVMVVVLVHCILVLQVDMSSNHKQFYKIVQTLMVMRKLTIRILIPDQPQQVIML